MRGTEASVLNKSNIRLGILSVLACLVYTIYCIANPWILGFVFVLPNQAQMKLILDPISFCFVAVGGITLTGITLYLIYRSRSTSRILYIISPMAYLPLSVYGIILRRWVPQFIAGNLLFFIPVSIAAIVVARLVSSFPDRFDQYTRGRRIAILVFLATSLAFTLSGVHFTNSVGAHSGDEGHYLIQAESLFHDLDLDIKNNLGCEPTANIKSGIHISPNARDGHWYSWHCPGLPILMFPTVPFGIIARHIVLGLISGLACTGLFVLSKMVNAKTSWTLLILFLFAFSAFWGVYSSRALPEVLGAALTIWAAVSILLAHRRPAVSSILAIICCGYLPWAHTRFIPVSLLAAGLYGLATLARQRPIKFKLIHATSFGFLMLSAYAVYWYLQSLRFEGGMAYPSDRLLFSYPAGAWLTIVSDRGILYILPLFAAMLVANIWIAFTNKSLRLHAIAALAFIAAVLATSSATIWFTGGSCVPGRFLLVVAPLLLPLTAKAMESYSPRSRCWIIFLGLISVAHFALMLINLEPFGKAFSNPPKSIASVFPVLHGLMRPFLGVDTNICHFFAVLFSLGTATVLVIRQDRKLIQALTIAIVGVAAVISSASRTSDLEKTNPTLYERLLSKHNIEHATIFVWPKNPEPKSIFEFSDKFASLKYQQITVSITTEDLGVRNDQYTISQPQLEINDWNGRNLRWTTLVAPFSPGKGQRALRLKGRITGDCVPILAIREGSQTLFEQALEVRNDGTVDRTVPLKYNGGNGHVYILLRLEGQGQYTGESTHWSPFSENLLKTANLTF